MPDIILGRFIIEANVGMLLVDLEAVSRGDYREPTLGDRFSTWNLFCFIIFLRLFYFSSVGLYSVQLN